MRRPRKLRRRFYNRYTPTVAKELIGKVLVRVHDGRRVSGQIVETEAYRGGRDPASHAFRGLTKRNWVMFGPAGFAYVYFVYGFHHCLNVSTEANGTPGAVLIRAIRPMDGVDLMARRRGPGELRTDGPGKLTQAMGIDLRLNGKDLTKSNELFVEDWGIRPSVRAGTRVGVSSGAKYKWRFTLSADQ